MNTQDQRLIEHGFPCHQVGAETQRERDTGQAPPINRLHIWWARRPLTPSRAAIVASLDSADTDPETFVRQLGIERVQALVHNEAWMLDEAMRARVRCDASDMEVLPVDAVILRALQKEDDRRGDNRELIAQMIAKDPTLASDSVLTRWFNESKPLPQPWPAEGEVLPVRRVMGDPAHVNARIEFARSEAVKAIVGREIKWAPEDLYGYARAFTNNPPATASGMTILDPTAGGGSIPLEALRLGHTVIANELKPGATVILHATLDYPARFGKDLTADIREWGERLLQYVEREMEELAPFSPLPEEERERLRTTLKVRSVSLKPESLKGSGG